MLRLNLNTSPAWIDLWPGVRVKVLPITSALIAEAVRSLTGLAPEAGPEVRFVHFTTAVARLAIVEWEGIGDIEGAPIDPTPEGISALMDIHQLNQAFRDLYVSKGFLLSAEKNVLSPLPNGTSVGAGNIADPVMESAPSARPN